MTTPTARSTPAASDSASIRLGVLAPLTPPGWAEAGRHLLAGIEQAAHDINEAGGVMGQALKLVVRDTAADPQRAAAAVAEFHRMDLPAVVGEFHSVVARAAAASAHALGLPFLCSSAVIDELVPHESDWVARLAPAQSHGWRIYADHLLDAAHRRVAVAHVPSAYWAAGTEILRERLAERGGVLVELDTSALSIPMLRDRLVSGQVTALLLLVGYPEPAITIVQAVRSDPRLAELTIGAPAGQPELAQWGTALEGAGAAVPFLRYLPERLTALGAQAAAALQRKLHAAPSFVAFEGYDTIAVLAEAIRHGGSSRASIRSSWPHLAVEGTRGVIRFSKAPGIPTWQWAWPTVQVVDRHPQAVQTFRVLRSQ